MKHWICHVSLITTLFATSEDAGHIMPNMPRILPGCRNFRRCHFIPNMACLHLRGTSQRRKRSRYPDQHALWLSENLRCFRILVVLCSFYGNARHEPCESD